MAWFKKKTENKEVVPFSFKEEEITLLPEKTESPEVPEELPELKVPAKTEPKPEQIVSKPKIVKTEKAEAEKFMKIENLKELIVGINDVNLEFDKISDGVARIIEIKEDRTAKIDELQNVLEDSSKKLMLIENTLFGG